MGRKGLVFVEEYLFFSKKHMNHGFGQNVCAIVVTWHIKKSFMATVRAVIHQVDHVIIVDNGSGPDTIQMLKAVQSLYTDKVTVIYNVENKGIGAAQNQGLGIALRAGYDWVLLLDHDSCPAPDMVAALLSAYAAMAGPGGSEPQKNIGLMAPNKKEKQSPKEMKLIMPGRYGFWRTFKNEGVVPGVRSVIASGSLIKTQVFRHIGTFNERFFMDYVDVEFCLRMRQNGWIIAAVRGAVLHHSLGSITGETFMGRGISVSHHDASRRFTMFRNRVIVWKQYFFSQPGYVFFDMGMAVYELVKICLFEYGPGHKLKSDVKGMMDVAVRS